MQPPIGGDTGFFPAAVIVAVREDLVHHLPGEFPGDIVSFIVDGELPQLSLAIIGAAIGRAVQQGAIGKAEAIVIKPRLLRGVPQGKGIALPAQRGMQQGLRLPGSVQQQGGHAGIAQGQGKAQGPFLPCRHRAKGRFMLRQQAVKHGCSVLSCRMSITKNRLAAKRIWPGVLSPAGGVVPFARASLAPLAAGVLLFCEEK